MITKSEANKALDNLMTMIDHLDFVGCLVDEEYTEFIENFTVIHRFIKQQEDK